MENYKYKPVIGLEIHAELKTITKMFCDSLNDPNEKHPNINICPICLSHPGTLPVINQEAVKKVIMAGLALNCKIAEDTFFERKNYFYPDLPKGYQISQYLKPFCYDGWLDLRPTSDVGDKTSDVEVDTNVATSQVDQTGKRIRITRIHLEEDAGRLYHDPKNDVSLVDYNRAGVPLMELVTEPDFETGQEVRDFTTELQLIWRYLGVSDADMEKGQMRVEVNISLTNPDGSWGTKVEVKNINSIKFASDAVDYEIKRQTELLEAGEKIKQETRGWDEFKKQTFSQRSKEEAHDYRYFPEPDLPPLHFDKNEIEKIKSELLELPEQRRERFKKQYNLPDHNVEIFIVNKSLGDYYEHVASELLSFDPFEHPQDFDGELSRTGHPERSRMDDKLDHLKKPEIEHQDKLFKLASNYLITEFKRMCDEVLAEPNDTKITPDMFADLIVRIFHGEVSSSGAQTVIKEMFATGKKPGEIIKEKNLEQVSNVEELNLAVAKVIADNPKAIEDYKAGKEASLKFLIGMAMRETKGKANPQVVERMIKDMLK